MHVQVNINMDSIPVFLRGGHIIARKERIRRSSAQMANDPFTLWVVLDSTGSAEGQVYLDDGRSFAFERGVYMHRQLKFAGGVLSCTAAPELPSTAVAPAKPGKYTTPAEIERIVVLGLPGGPKGWKVSRQDAQQTVDAEPGPIMMKPELADSTPALVVRKPNLLIGEDWSLKFSS